jgi:hypothetical protein
VEVQQSLCNEVQCMVGVKYPIGDLKIPDAVWALPLLRNSPCRFPSLRSIDYTSLKVLLATSNHFLKKERSKEELLKSSLDQITID